MWIEAKKKNSLSTKVQIKVNGEVVPYVMKVGEAGEAFFVFETEHEVPEEFQTSPIMEAVSEKSEEVSLKKLKLKFNVWRL